MLWTRFLIDVPVELQIMPPGDFNTTVKDQRRKLQILWSAYFAGSAVYLTVGIFAIKLFNSRRHKEKPPIANA